MSRDGRRTASPEYQDPADFLANPLAGVPRPPESTPVAVATLRSREDVASARHLVRRHAVSSSAVARDIVDAFVGAVHETLVNGLEHAGTRVRLAMWTETSTLTCLVTDTGPGIPDLLSGYSYPEATGPRGLWVARQLCEGLYLSNHPGAGCSVLLTTG